MQYFTFLGLGDYKKGYSDVYYSFLDNNDYSVVSKFVQEAILDRFKNQISDVHIFVTLQSRERYKEEIGELFSKYPNIHYELVLIDNHINFNEFVSKLLNKIRENQHIIIDITHSFRHIPMKLLFAIKYIESSKNVFIDHLYYGRLLPNNQYGEVEEALIEDFIIDYKLQNVASLLHHFDKGLTFSIPDLKELVEIDDKVMRFLEALSSFNQMIEYCEFDRCINSVNKIVENCRSIEKNYEQYQMIIPIVRKIKEKFVTFEEKKSNVEKKIELIRILVEHERYQVAITFTDQFFREELIRSVLDSTDMNFSISRWLTKNNLACMNKHGDFSYKFSQYLIFNVFDLRNTSGVVNYPYRNRITIDTQKVKNTSQTLSSYKIHISEFYETIRNHINHGTTIQRKEKIDANLISILECISKFGR